MDTSSHFPDRSSECVVARLLSRVREGLYSRTDDLARGRSEGKRRSSDHGVRRPLGQPAWLPPGFVACLITLVPYRTIRFTRQGVPIWMSSGATISFAGSTS